MDYRADQSNSDTTGETIMGLEQYKTREQLEEAIKNGTAPLNLIEVAVTAPAINQKIIDTLLAPSFVVGDTEIGILITMIENAANLWMSIFAGGVPDIRTVDSSTAKDWTDLSPGDPQ